MSVKPFTLSAILLGFVMIQVQAGFFSRGYVNYLLNRQAITSRYISFTSMKRFPITNRLMTMAMPLPADAVKAAVLIPENMTAEEDVPLWTVAGLYSDLVDTVGLVLLCYEIIM
ncbi:hypothetical protein QR680_015917 [Steinernema hermaphroditum]|uniref:Uncharacterized protein n=1 Tax=Steinernema hermaphroditum TaxID=289476 RepID=A0AA39LLQ3_9BILA|nr:hypothetical protein QR680_015917 [Steinernema hermaphroditum]